MNYPLLNVFLTTMWFFLWILWFFMLFRVFGDLFRDASMGGWGKAGWSVFLILLPFLGVLVYLIARGRGMAERDAARRQQADQEFRSYVRDAVAEENGAATNGSGAAYSTAGSRPGQADQLAKLAELKKHGDITEEEFQRAKASVLAG